MFQRKMKKLTAPLLLFFMVFSIMPVQVWAEESTTGSAIEWVPNEDECTDPSHNHGTEGDNADGTEETDEEKAAREEAERLAAEQAAQEEKEAAEKAEAERQALLAAYTDKADELYTKYADTANAANNVAEMTVEEITAAQAEVAEALEAIADFDAEANAVLGDDYTAWAAAQALYALETELENAADTLAQAKADKEAEKEKPKYSEAYQKVQAKIDDMLNWYLKGNMDATEKEIEAIVAEMDSTTAWQAQVEIADIGTLIGETLTEVELELLAENNAVYLTFAEKVNSVSASPNLLGDISEFSVSNLSASYTEASNGGTVKWSGSANSITGSVNNSTMTGSTFSKYYKPEETKLTLTYVGEADVEISFKSINLLIISTASYLVSLQE